MNFLDLYSLFYEFSRHFFAAFFAAFSFLSVFPPSFPTRRREAGEGGPGAGRSGQGQAGRKEDEILPKSAKSL